MRNSLAGVGCHQNGKRAGGYRKHCVQGRKSRNRRAGRMGDERLTSGEAIAAAPNRQVDMAAPTALRERRGSKLKAPPGPRARVFNGKHVGRKRIRTLRGHHWIAVCTEKRQTSLVCPLGALI